MTDPIDLLFRALTEGGPFALGLVGWSAWWYERRENKSMSRQLLGLATAQIEATVKCELAIHANTQVIDRLLGR